MKVETYRSAGAGTCVRVREDDNIHEVSLTLDEVRQARDEFTRILTLHGPCLCRGENRYRYHSAKCCSTHDFDGATTEPRT
jgi:hypothetical protein